MPTGAAGYDVDFSYGTEFRLADLHFVEENATGIEGDASQRSFADGARLLIDFLEHEVLEAGLLRHNGIPGHMLYWALDGFPVEIRELHACGCDHGEVAIRQKENIARVVENCRNIGGNEVFIIAQADY